VPLVITEKMDGSNTSLESGGCYARTHAAAPGHLSFDALKALHATLKYSIPERTQVFGEWCYAQHSIPYDSLPGYFLMFGIRELHIGSNDEEFPFWYSWGELENWAINLGLPTVPILFKGTVSSVKELQELTESLVKQPSACGTIREGVVVRIADVFSDEHFSKYVMKWVRKDHVQTSDHWKDQEIIKNKLKI
jgi:hypothetical protein